MADIIYLRSPQPAHGPDEEDTASLITAIAQVSSYLESLQKRALAANLEPSGKLLAAQALATSNMALYQAALALQFSESNQTSQLA